MPVTINGSGSIAGLSVGGLGSGVVNTATLADGAATGVKQGAGSIIQVQSTVLTAAGEYSVATGGISGDVITCSITPSSSSNKVLVICSLFCSSPDEGIYGTIYRAGSVVSGAIGDAAGSRQRVSVNTFVYNDNRASELNKTYLDSPSTTSATTYSIRIGGSRNGTTNYYINRPYQFVDNNRRATGASTLTLMEVKG